MFGTALANLVHLEKLQMSRLKFDLTSFDANDSHHIKPLVGVEELSITLDELYDDHEDGKKFVHLISTMFPNVKHFELHITENVSNRVV